ncbi:hypothetical protein H0H87_008436 [Tephrocybe sp. NHM501043]|nr:hypothetical protein H0H87_008436 [Tephrocybe sp. NHM501043]
MRTLPPLASGQTRHQNDVSKMIGEMWRAESEDVKNYWEECAKEKKREHDRMYPGYVYKPRPRVGETKLGKKAEKTQGKERAGMKGEMQQGDPQAMYLIQEYLDSIRAGHLHPDEASVDITNYMPPGRSNLASSSYTMPFPGLDQVQTSSLNPAMYMPSMDRNISYSESSRPTSPPQAFDYYPALQLGESIAFDEMGAYAIDQYVIDPVECEVEEELAEGITFEQWKRENKHGRWF